MNVNFVNQMFLLEELRFASLLQPSDRVVKIVIITNMDYKSDPWKNYSPFKKSSPKNKIHQQIKKLIPKNEVRICWNLYSQSNYLFGFYGVLLNNLDIEQKRSKNVKVIIMSFGAIRSEELSGHFVKERKSVVETIKSFYWPFNSISYQAQGQKFVELLLDPMLKASTLFAAAVRPTLNQFGEKVKRGEYLEKLDSLRIELVSQIRNKQVRHNLCIEKQVKCQIPEILDPMIASDKP